MMQVRVRLFAMLREAQQAEWITVEVPDGGTVGMLRQAIAETYPGLAGFLAASRVAAALRFVPDPHVLEGCEELALIPPVSGG
jgi:molybdopterin converting factor small subunit